MRYNLAVQVNPDEYRIPFTILIGDIGNNIFKSIILDDTGAHYCDNMEGNNYDVLKDSGIAFIQANLGQVIIVNEVDFIQEDLNYFEDAE